MRNNRVAVTRVEAIDDVNFSNADLYLGSQNYIGGDDVVRASHVK